MYSKQNGKKGGIFNRVKKALITGITGPRYALLSHGDLFETGQAPKPPAGQSSIKNEQLLIINFELCR